MSAALPVYRDRPAILPSAGGRVYISVHDAEYLRQRSEWKRKLADAHPDAGGTSFRFRQAVKARDRWQATEEAWYGQHGLTPPLPVSTSDARVSATSLTELLAQLPDGVGRPWMTTRSVARMTGMRRLLTLLADGAYHTTAECRAVVGLHAITYIARLRARGFDIPLDASYRTGLGTPAYRLISAP